MPIRSQLQNDSNIEHQTNNQKENQKKKTILQMPGMIGEHEKALPQ